MTNIHFFDELRTYPGNEKETMWCNFPNCNLELEGTYATKHTKYCRVYVIHEWTEREEADNNAFQKAGRPLICLDLPWSTLELNKSISIPDYKLTWKFPCLTILLLFLPAVDGRISYMGHRELPWCSKLAIPFQFNMGSRYSPLQQVCDLKWHFKFKHLNLTSISS